MCSVLQHKMDELKEGLRQRDELIEVGAGPVEILNFGNKALGGTRGCALGGKGVKMPQLPGLFLTLKFHTRDASSQA